MKKLEYTVQFVTPAFLGNADQSGQWRTPPFKALLRQWWRMLNADLSLTDMLKQEGDIFGAALDDTGMQSRVRVRLDRWTAGTMKEWKKIGDVMHLEVGNIDSSLYLGYGPIAKGAKLKSNAAIQATEQAALTLIFDDKKITNLNNQLSDTMQLAHWFGTLGGRSRNGWGSAHFTAKFEKLIPFEGLIQSVLIKKISAPINDCLKFDHPKWLGTDSNGALIWQAKSLSNSWEAAMKELAKIKIALRTSFSFVGHSKGKSMVERHVLSYPVTHHETSDYDKNARLPNQLRFKVHKTTDGKYLPVAFHFPVKTPTSVLSGRGRTFSEQEQLAVWQKAHTKLDELMKRIGK